MKNIILSLSFLAFVVSCSNNEQKPVDPDLDTSVAQDDSAFKEGASEAEETASAEDPAAAGLALINGSDCRTCHHDTDKLIGPSYHEVAEKYTDADLDYLAEKIIDGGKGVWGEIPMTPHPGVNMEDAKTMVKYVLSLK
ncbi:MAG: cytochrome C [Weeksellaceae bacterium]|jgi:cytochrome c|nr:cytochrome C [Weeksellaceae bacterium]